MIARQKSYAREGGAVVRTVWLVQCRRRYFVLSVGSSKPPTTPVAGGLNLSIRCLPPYNPYMRIGAPDSVLASLYARLRNWLEYRERREKDAYLDWLAGHDFRSR